MVSVFLKKIKSVKAQSKAPDQCLRVNAQQILLTSQPYNSGPGGVAYVGNCPPNYTYHDEKKTFEDYREIENRAVKCDKPREVPKCCKEPPYCV